MDLSWETDLEAEIVVVCINETKKAYLVKCQNMQSQEIKLWIPKSQLIARKTYGNGNTTVFLIPAWLAEKHNLEASYG